MNLIKGVNQVVRLPFLFFIWFYQNAISPFFGPSCIYYPSCSDYSRQAFLKHGVFGGLILSVTRIARCHPFHQGGVDEVPDKISFKAIRKNG